MHAFNDGQSPESILLEFPALKSAQVYGAIGFYLDHQGEIDSYLENSTRGWEAMESAVPMTCSIVKPHSATTCSNGMPCPP